MPAAPIRGRSPGKYLFLLPLEEVPPRPLDVGKRLPPENIMDPIDHTIAALSTPPGESGVALIRMSGGKAFDILSTAFHCEGKRDPAAGWEHRRLYHGDIVDERGEAVDEVMCAVMRGPDSYTGEDTVEITCHGGMLIVNKIINILFRLGARAAKAGEFTKRAFLNGKMDLIQAEAVCDLIHAKSELQRKVAREQLAGGLSQQIRQLADGVLQLLGEVEVNIDFLEEDIDAFDADHAANMLNDHRQVLASLLKSGPLGRPFREGYNLVIAGPVNAGKSSLFNRLVGQDRAIVTEIPGTTRDVLREPLVIGGLVFILHDTAGLRMTTGDKVETIGRGLAEKAAVSADMVVFVLDGAEEIGDEDAARIARLDPKRSIVAVNKADLSQVLSVSGLRKRFPKHNILHLSAKSGQGVEELKEEVIDLIGRDTISWIARERIVLNARLVALLEAADRQLAVLLERLPGVTPLEVLAVEIRELLGYYEEATGRKYSENLLDHIFSRFCIGK
jgi:tRNA modification GTPase